VFSPRRAVPCRPVPSRAEPSSKQVAHRVASPRLASLLPDNSYKHLDDSRVGKGHVTALAVTQQLERFPLCQIQEFIGVRSSISQEFSRVVGSRRPRKIRSKDEELTCD
jgi:hypothetical protein